MSYQLINDDCLNAMDELIKKGIKFNAIITDPPYQKTQNTWDSIIPLEPMWNKINKLIYPNTPVILFGSQPFTSKLILSNEKYFRYSLIWEKTKAGGFLNAKRMPLAAHEDICIFYKKLCIYNPQMTKGTPYIKKAITNGDKGNYGKFNRVGSINNNQGTRHPRSVIKMSNDNHNNLHKTQKPIELMEYLIKTYTCENDIILDFTFGSCSTGIACLNTNRNFIGIEKDFNYFNIGKSRMDNHLITKKED